MCCGVADAGWADDAAGHNAAPTSRARSRITPSTGAPGRDVRTGRTATAVVSKEDTVFSLAGNTGISARNAAA
jgi:hypothetical protein